MLEIFGAFITKHFQLLEPIVAFLITIEIIFVAFELKESAKVVNSNEEVLKKIDMVVNESVKVVNSNEEVLKKVDMVVHENAKVVNSNKELLNKVDIVVKKIDLLERKELLQNLAITARKAKEEVLHLTYTFSTPDEEPEMNALIEAIENISRKTNPPKIYFLGPPHDNNVDRLYIRQKAGAEVKINKKIQDYDTRFQVVDGKFITITIGDPAGPSRIGYYIESEFLGHMFKDYFDKLWTEPQSINYEDYIKQLIRDKLQNIIFQASPKLISRSLGLNEEETGRILNMIGTYALEEQSIMV